MPITIDKQNGATVISVRGEIDHHSARTIMENIDHTISSALLFPVMEGSVLLACSVATLESWQH